MQNIKNDVRFVFTSSCLWEGSCLIYIICVCLRIVVLKHIVLCLLTYSGVKTYRVVFVYV